MATTALVSHDIEVGRRIVAALTRASIPVNVYLWAFIPQLNEWQFMVATPLVDTKGPRAAYGDVERALQKEGILEQVPLRRIFLKSPSDKVLKSLEKESKSVPHEAFRVVNEQIGGSFVDDAYVYTGFIQINRLQGRTGPTAYSVFYAPYEGPSGIVTERKFQGNEKLRYFLRNDLRISDGVVEAALRNLDEQPHATIPNVELKNKDLRRLGLA
jgi:hypothetical protein